MLRTAALLVLLSTAVPAQAQSQRYELDPVHTRVLFAVSHAGFSQALGTIGGSTGMLVFDPADWTGARVEVEVPLANLDLGDADWNAAALGRRLLRAETYPTARFASALVEPRDATHARVCGDLALHGAVAPLCLEVVLNKLDRHPMPPFRHTVGFSATGTLDRKAFGIDAWEGVIGDTVELRIEAEAVRRDAPEASMPAGEAPPDPPSPPQPSASGPVPPQPSASGPVPPTEKASMTWKNTHDRWGPLSQLLHWLIVLLILGQGTLGLLMTDMRNSPGKIEAYALHKSIGLTLLALVVLRLLWRLFAGAPLAVAGMPRWQARVASLTHGLLYALLFAIPLTGWLLNSAAGFPLQWFGLFNLPDIAPSNHDLHEWAEDTHELLFWTLVVVALVHAGAAIHHHLFLRDATLARMLPAGWLRVDAGEARTKEARDVA